jgi:hypothetical protein
MAKATRTKIVTPKGLAKWAKVSIPDTKFNPDGVYSIDICIPEDECKSLCSLLDGIVNTQFEETKAELKPAKAKELQVHKPYQLEYNENDEETGNIIFKFVKNAVITTKKGDKIEVKPKIYDAKGIEVTTLLNIGNGSTIKVSGQGSPWYVPATGKVGVKLYLDAVQVINVVEFGGGNAESYGFGEEEGFTVDNNATPPSFEETDF